MTTARETVEDVAAFWNTEACGAHFVIGAKDDIEFFERYRQFRYATEWHLMELVPFAEANGKRVLEIGCGNGADGVTFAQHGALYTGVDLTAEAVEATRRHFAVLGLAGEFRVENAERLSFPEASFDWVYSHGVLHHTPDPQRTFEEIYRVLRPGGRAIIMLYHRHSFNYYVRILGYMRLRLLATILAHLGHCEADRQRLAVREVSGVRGNVAPEVWTLHFENFLRYGWAYLKPSRFVHHATDGPGCPYAYVFTRDQAKKMFARFSRVETRVAHFPLRKYRRGRCVPLAVERFLATRLGWYLFVFATK
jgi:SAM-dependent methyltransferase